MYLQELFTLVVFVMLHQRQPMLLFVLSVAFVLSSSDAMQDGNTRQLISSRFLLFSIVSLPTSLVAFRFDAFFKKINKLCWFNVSLLDNAIFVNSQTLLSSLTK